MKKVILLLIMFSSLSSYATVVTYNTTWNYYDGPAYPRNVKQIDASLTFSGPLVQNNIAYFDQQFEEVLFEFTLNDQDYAVDIDESNAIFSGSEYGRGDRLSIRGVQIYPAETDTVEWSLSIYSMDWPGSDGPETSVELRRVVDTATYYNGFPSGTFVEWQEVPLPASLWMFISGVLGLVSYASISADRK